MKQNEKEGRKGKQVELLMLADNVSSWLKHFKGPAMILYTPDCQRPPSASARMPSVRWPVCELEPRVPAIFTPMALKRTCSFIVYEELG